MNYITSPVYIIIGNLPYFKLKLKCTQLTISIVPVKISFSKVMPYTDISLIEVYMMCLNFPILKCILLWLNCCYLFHYVIPDIIP